VSVWRPRERYCNYRSKRQFRRPGEYSRFRRHCTVHIVKIHERERGYGVRGWRVSWWHGVPDAHHHRLNHGQAEEGRDGGIDSVPPLAKAHAPDFKNDSDVNT
jgi:hypothetical protein